MFVASDNGVEEEGFRAGKEKKREEDDHKSSSNNIHLYSYAVYVGEIYKNFYRFDWKCVPSCKIDKKKGKKKINLADICR